MTQRDTDQSRVIAGACQPEYWFREGCHITEIWNDAADASVSVVRARVAPGATTRWHSLDGITERYLVTTGYARVQLGDGTDRDVAAGDAVLIPPRMAQRIANIGDSDLEFMAVCTPHFRSDAYRDLEGVD